MRIYFIDKTIRVELVFAYMVEQVSIQDVARRAKPSIATVSRVMNGTAYPVSARLGTEILRAIKELNYTPDPQRRDFETDTARLSASWYRTSRITFLGRSPRGATDEALKNRYLTPICDTGRNPVNEMGKFTSCYGKTVSGASILAGGGIDSAEYRDMIARQVERSAMFGLLPRSQSLRRA
ncbi:MAG: LacI family DNA-binding transcriptional regulator [Marinilabiliales bacterium]|nr:LacI family DNA-binding transcriptional regulator [Marinilabiliales bacterium]